MNAKLIVRYVIREAMGLMVMGVALFWSAGRTDWLPAWAALGVMLAWIVATGIIVIYVHPGLLAERLGPRKGAKAWDTAILSMVGLAQLARYIVAGLDERYGWSGDFAVGAQVAALVGCMGGYALVTWATASNAFFSQIVRIQTERGHTVVSGGPYRFVRHPGYVGALLFELMVPIVLGSWWALAVSSINVVLLALRTALEDRTLLAELAGYADYARRVRYRLVPGIW